MPDAPDPYLTAGASGAGLAFVGFVGRWLFARGSTRLDELGAAVQALQIEHATLTGRVATLERDQGAIIARQEAISALHAEVARVLEAVTHLADRLDEMAGRLNAMTDRRPGEQGAPRPRARRQEG